MSATTAIVIEVIIAIAFIGLLVFAIKILKNKKKVNARIATSDLFYESKNVQYMAKVFKKERQRCLYNENATRNIHWGRSYNDARKRTTIVLYR